MAPEFMLLNTILKLSVHMKKNIKKYVNITTHIDTLLRQFSVMQINGFNVRFILW